MRTIIGFATLTWIALPLAAQQHGGTHWEYEGTHGPANWSSLDPAYAKCTGGKQQSPIDIRQTRHAELPPITFSYQPVPLSMIDNGHTIQVIYAPGSFITIGHDRYELQQFHFHHPAEERVRGKAYPLVAHLVHKNQVGRLAVVAVLLEEGTANPLVDRLWAHLPVAKDTVITPEQVTIDATLLLPSHRGYYTFSGSLTTPPCTEGVTWFVLKEATQVSPNEVSTFAEKYPHNARPLQPVNHRIIQETN
ncbi:MAG TPA: carbonic anhydrase family protein [Gemmatimonadales bacterium]|nr:carbonic anhydrase family protein [Gemmatimonadales bacterium]